MAEEDVENGFLFRARRRRVDDYIELRGPDWPADERFYTDVVDPGENYGWLRVRFVAADGLHPEPAVERREAGTLIAWVVAYENNATGTPYVGQATVVRNSPTVARLDHLELVDDAPATVALELVRTATHAAADKGAKKVVMQLDLQHLHIAGFRPKSDGGLAVDTSFLDEDPEAAEMLVRDTLAAAGLWGRDRDQAGRYLPRTRLGRLVHRLRHGPSDSWPRIYVG